MSGPSPSPLPSFRITGIFQILALLFYCSNLFAQNSSDLCNAWRIQMDTTSNLDFAMEKSQALFLQVDETCQAEIYLLYGDVSRLKMNLDSALHFMSKGIELAKSVDATELVVHGLFKKAGIFIKKQQLETAVQLLDEGRQLLSAFPDSERWIGYYGYMASIADEKTDYESSIAYIDSSIVVTNRLKDSTELPTLYHNKGLYLMRLSEYEKATESLIKALEIKKELTGQGQAATFYILGTCYNVWKQHEQATYYLQKGIAQSKSDGNDFILMKSYLDLATANRKLQLQEEALSAIDSALVILQTLDSPNDLAKGLLQKGIIYLHHFGLHEQAEQLFLEANNLASKYSHNSTLFSTTLAMLRLYLSKEDFRKAKKELSNLEVLAKKHKVLEFDMEFHKAAQEYYETAEEKGKALQHFKQYYHLKDSIANQEVLSKIASLETKYDTKEKELNIVQLTQEKKTQQTIVQKARFRQKVFFAIAAILLAFMFFGGWVYWKLSQQQTALKKAHEELSEINQVKNHLFSIIAHDVRGMIMPFQRVGRILKHHIDKGNFERTITLSTELEKNAQNLSDMLDNLLQWSLQQMDGYTYTPIRFSIEEEFQQIVDGFRQKAAYKNISLQIEQAEALSILFDKGAFHVIFRNLIGNALKFTERGTVTIAWKKRQDQLIFSVKDTGVGMETKDLDQIFQLHNKETKTGTAGERGTGLGLNLVHRFVTMHDGKIEVDSKKGEGTTFTLTFLDLKPSLVKSLSSIKA